MIKDLEELQKFLKLCRKQGITEIRYGETHVKFGELPRKGAEKDEESEPVFADAVTGLMPDQMAFYSSGGLPPNEDQ